MYEPRTAPLLTRRQFFGRMARHLVLAGSLVAVSLILGIAGYIVFAHMNVVDAFLNSAMLLGGMGPVGDLPTTQAKLFAGVFALYAGLVFIIGAGVIFAPIAHRILHRLHVDDDDDDDKRDGDKTKAEEED